MKKAGILNSSINSLIGELAQGDTIGIVDASVSIPVETKKIDIALIKGVPGFIETLENVLNEVESNDVIIPMEMEDENSEIYEKTIEKAENRKVVKVSNEQLKLMLKKCNGVIRTGESTPYSNIIIKSSSIF